MSRIKQIIDPDENGNYFYLDDDMRPYIHDVDSFLPKTHKNLVINFERAIGYSVKRKQSRI